MQALVDNWFTTAAELAALSDETARSLGLPLRLKAVVGEMLAGSVAAAAAADGPAAAARAASIDAATQLRQQAEAQLDGSSAAQSLDAALDSSSEGDASEDEGRSGLAEAVAAMRGSGGAGDAAAAAAWDQADLPIEQRRCPPIRRAGFSYTDLPKVTKRTRPQKYALSVSWVGVLLCLVTFHVAQGPHAAMRALRLRRRS